ncbi:flagellar motor protein MotB [Gemmobacter lanyuensis]
MATLLMAFFVIMLMTAKSDQPKFNAFAAVMRQTFGTVPDGGDSVLQLNFGPQSGEQTDEPPGTTPQSGDPNTPQSGDEEGTGKKGSGSGDAAKEAAEALGKAMRDAVSKGQIKVESDQGEVIVRLPRCGRERGRTDRAIPASGGRGRRGRGRGGRPRCRAIRRRRAERPAGRCADRRQGCRAAIRRR